MFSVQQKRAIADGVQKLLRETGHPELPEGEIQFDLHVRGADSWSWADIRNNAACRNPSVNPHNERMASQEQPDPTAGLSPQSSSTGRTGALSGQETSNVE